MDEKKLKTIVALVYLALCVVVAVLLIDIQIKNAILDQAAQTRRELDRLQADLELSNGLIVQATGAGRVDYFPAVPSADPYNDRAGISMEDLGGKAPANSGTEETPLWDETEPATTDGDSGLSAQDF